jgi:hypothetical protein
MASSPARGSKRNRWEGSATVKMLELLRKGFGYLLMSMGVSSPVKKAGPDPKPAPKTESGS